MSLALASPASAARRLPAPTPAQHRAAEARCSKLHPTVKAKCVDHLVLEKKPQIVFLLSCACRPSHLSIAFQA